MLPPLQITLRITTAGKTGHAQQLGMPNTQARTHIRTHAHTHTHTFNGPFSGTTRVSRYQKGKTNLDFTEARDSEWEWHQLGHMQVCISLQTDNHTSAPLLSFLQAGCPSCHPTNSVKALKDIPKFLRKCPSCEGSRLPSNTRFLGPTRVHTLNGILIGSAVFAVLTKVSSKQTKKTHIDHATSVATGCI